MEKLPIEGRIGYFPIEEIHVNERFQSIQLQILHAGEYSITALIERGKDSEFTAFSYLVPGVYANGDSEEEVRSEFMEMMQEQAEYMEQRTGIPPIFKDAKVEFTFLET